MAQIVATAIILLIGYAALARFRPGIALLTVPLTAVALGFMAVTLESPALLLLAVLHLLVTLSIVAIDRRDVEAGIWARVLASWVLVILILLLIVAAATISFALIGAGVFLPLFFFLGIAGIIAGAIGYGSLGRRAAAAVVFSTLGASMRQNLPLPMALDCAATGRRDAGRRILLGIKKWLLQGYPLAESVHRGYPRCPSRFLAMLTAAEQVGQMPTAILAIEQDMKSQDIERHRFRPVHPIYPAVVLSIAFLIVLALTVFVMPKFTSVLTEMAGGTAAKRATLPAATLLLMEITHALRTDSRFHVAALLILLMGVVVLLYNRIRARRTDKPRWLSWMGDTLKWHLPVLHWFENNRSLLQVTELLRLALSSGSTVDRAIQATLQLDVNLQVRRRLRRWLRRVEQGEPVGAAARRCGLGSPLAWAFDTDTGSTPAVLGLLESFYRSNYSYRVNLMRFILWPCAIIALGCVVGFIVYAMFVPGVFMITQFTEYVYP
jgi:type IV pilus assembly protein PilC